MPENEAFSALKKRLKQGAVLSQTAHEEGQYVVHLTTDPPIAFPAADEEQVDRVLHELGQI